MKNKLTFLPMLWFGKVVATLIGWIAPSRGSAMSGTIVLRLMPGFLSRFTGIDPDKTIFITGSNGKSTSNNLIVHAFRTAGRTVATNLEGANMATGVATTLIKNSTMRGRLKAEYLILEVDERYLAKIRRIIPARHICVTNLQKDQVQRNGDPGYVYAKVAAAMGSDVTAYVNNEEPRSASLAHLAGRSVAYSVAPQDTGTATVEDPFAVSMPCPLCWEALDFDGYNLSNVGTFHCPGCGFGSSASPDYLLDGVDYDAQVFAVNGEQYHMAYGARHFLYNYVLCCAVATQFGIAAPDQAAAFQSFTNIGGRLEQFAHAGKSILYVRIKQENPETLQSAIDTIAADPHPKILGIGLQVVHDMVPHYNNTAYTFDTTFKRLFASGVDACLCFGTVNCYDIAKRLVYDGFPAEKIIVVDSDSPRQILDALAACGPEKAYMITWLGLYDSLRPYADGRQK